MTEKVTKLALTSRIIVLILQLLANSALPDHHPDVFRSPIALSLNSTERQQYVPAQKPSWLDKTVDFCLGGLRHWDGEYFLHVAEHSYTYENTLAFYPLYPIVVGQTARALHHLGLGLSLRSWILLVAVLLNVYIFCKAANVLYALTMRIFNDLNKSWYAAMLFCFNPASVFFSAAYSETLFCWLTFSLMRECVSELRTLRLILTLALSVVARSNGLTNIGFVVYFLLRQILLRSKRWFQALFKLLFVLCLGLLPLTIFYHHAFKLYCQAEDGEQHNPAVLEYARVRNYVLAGARLPGNSPWCDASFPNPYGYIQSHYWNVGFLRYYELKQLPHFLLALPVLGFLFRHCYLYLKHFFYTLPPHYTYMQMLKEFKSFPFVVHALFLTSFCTLFVHVQISTRLLCAASPCIYWFGADHFQKPLDQIRLRSRPGLILCWFASYALIGTILFSNNMPWT